MRLGRTSVVMLLAIAAAVAGCGGGGGGETTYKPAAVNRCLRAERVPLQARPDKDVSVEAGHRRVYDRYRTPHYSDEETVAAARLFVRPDLAAAALESGPRRAIAAYVPPRFIPRGDESPDSATVGEFAGRRPGAGQVDLLVFGSPASAERAEGGADDQARALEQVTIAGSDAGTGKDVAVVRDALRQAGGPTREREGNVLLLWRTRPQQAERRTITGCLDRVKADQG